MGCSAGGCCFGCIIVLMNTLFGIIALLFIAIGSVLHFLADIAQQYFGDMLKGMTEAFKGFGFDFDQLLKGDSTFSILSLVKQVSIPFIIIGVILLIICFLGCCSVYCSNKTMMIVYMAILGTLLAAQILAFVIIYAKTPEYRTSAIESLKTSVTNDYEGRSSQSQNETTNFFTTILDLVQNQLQCCGIDNYKNFDSASKWQAKKQSGQKIPITCCVFTSDGKIKDVNKCQQANDKNYAHIETPCWSYVDDLTSNQKMTLIAIVAGILGFQAIILMLAICFCVSLKSKIGPI